MHLRITDLGSKTTTSTIIIQQLLAEPLVKNFCVYTQVFADALANCVAHAATVSFVIASLMKNTLVALAYTHLQQRSSRHTVWSFSTSSCLNGHAPILTLCASQSPLYQLSNGDRAGLLAKEVAHLSRAMQDELWKLFFQEVQAHSSIDGNERADALPRTSKKRP